MNIGIFVPTLRFGGGERVAVNLINGLVKYDCFNIKVFVYDKKQVDYKIDERAEIISINEETDVSSIYRKLFSFISKIKKIRSKLKKYKIDVALSIMTSMNILTLLSNQSAKVIVTEHNIIRDNKSIFNYIVIIMMKFLYIKSDKIVAVSNGVRDSLKTILKDCNIDVIYNPLDINDIRLNSLESLDCKFDNYILGVGRLTKQKGFDILIKSFSRLSDKNIKLVIIGNGEEKESLQSLVKKLCLSSKVIFLGFQKNPYKYMKNSSCFVLSSRWEGFGLVLAEAMISGAKVVSFDCKSGPAEILENGKIGYLAEPESIEDLSSKIEICLKNNFYKEEVEERIKEFDISYVVDKYYNLIMSV